jgi:hypothetical protein
MSQVKTIVARFGRKRQPAQYESAEAMLEFTLQAAEDGSLTDISIDHVGIGERLLGVAKNLVLRELGVIAPGQDASAATAAGEGSAETAKPKATRAKKADAKEPAATTGAPDPNARQISTNPENRVGPSDFPGETATAQAPKANGAASDFPGETATAAKPAATPAATPASVPAAGTPTAEELTAYVSQLVREKKIDSPTVKAVSRAFGAEKIAQIDPSKLAEYKKQVDAKVAEFAAASDL